MNLTKLGERRNVSFIKTSQNAATDPSTTSNARSASAVMRVLTSDGAYPERALSKECTPLVRENAAELIESVSNFLAELKINSFVISSGFRTLDANKAAGGSKRSNHMTGCALDIADKDRSLGKLVEKSIVLLAKHGLYAECPQSTPGWCHLQTVAPRSGHRIFRP